MLITEKDVAYVADLANLELTDQERRSMVKDLNSILDYVDRLNELDTTNVPPMAQISAAFSNGAIAARDDQQTPCLPREQALQNAPVTDGGFFKVPKVIEK